MAQDTLTVIDNRTGKHYEIPIVDGAIPAPELRKIKTSADDFGVMSYDPAFMNTANCRSRITFIDGDKGILRYRGYPIEQLAERRSFLEVAYLLVFGELPEPGQLSAWTEEVTHHTMVHENIKKLMEAFRYDAHPMGMFVSTIGALSTFYPDAKHIGDITSRHLQMLRLIGKVPTIAAYTYRHTMGLPYVMPDNELGYTANFLSLMFKMTEQKYHPDPALVKAMDVLFILHADHEQNCSTSAMRGIGSSHADPYSALAGAAAALYGPLHGGANEAVLVMLNEIGSIANVPAFVKRVKAGEGRLMGFGHRVYKSVRPAREDPQADGRRGVRSAGQEPAHPDRARARADRARGRLLHQPQAVPERGLLLGPDLPGDEVPGVDLPGAVRDREDRRLAGAVGRDAARPGAEDRAPAADLHRPGRARGAQD